MRAEILAIGDEVLEGKTLNTNAAFLGRQLSHLGYEIYRNSTLRDDPEQIIQGMKEALARSEVVITTGGLGPTIDDLTFISAQKLLGNTSTHLPNPVGTCPGHLFRHEGHLLVLLPGPPYEMEAIFDQSVRPHLSKGPWHLLEMQLCFVKELELDPLLRKIQQENPDVKIGIYPSLGTVQLRFAVKEGRDRFKSWQGQIQRAFPTHYFEAPSIAEAVHRKLIETKQTLSLAESCTGGGLAARLVAFPDASKYLLGSLVVYSNEWKEQFLGVKPQTLLTKGAVSREAVCEMAEGLLKRTKAHFAVAVSGIAGPTGGTMDKPVGTIYIAIAERGGLVDAGKIQAPAHRAGAIEFASLHALGALWRRLTYKTMSFS